MSLRFKSTACSASLKHESRQQRPMHLPRWIHHRPKIGDTTRKSASCVTLPPDGLWPNVRSHRGFGEEFTNPTC